MIYGGNVMHGVLCMMRVLLCGVRALCAVWLVVCCARAE